MMNEPAMLVVCFDPTDKKVYHNLQNQLQQLTKKSPNALATLMANGRMVVKRRAWPDKDRKLFDLLNATGAQCSFVRPSSEPATQKKDVQAQPELMECPHCGHGQPPGDECIRCGVIFAKAKAGQPASTGTGEAAKTSATDTQQPPETALQARSATTQATTTAEKPGSAQSINRYWQWLKGRPLPTSGLLEWSQRFKDAVTRAGVMFVVAVVVQSVFLWLVNYLWFIYTWTPSGKHYLETNPEMGAALNELFLDYNLLLGFQATVIAAASALFFGIVARFFMVNRLLFTPLGFFGRTLFWGLPVAAATAWLATLQEIWQPFSISFFLLFFPSLCLAGRCMELAQILLPDISMIGETVFSYGKEGFLNITKRREMFADLAARIKSGSSRPE